MSKCEWNPDGDCAATYDMQTKTHYGCQRTATLCLGSITNWHLCDDCANLPFFKRFRKRVALKKIEEPKAMMPSQTAEQAPDTSFEKLAAAPVEETAD